MVYQPRTSYPLLVNNFLEDNKNDINWIGVSSCWYIILFFFKTYLWSNYKKICIFFCILSRIISLWLLSGLFVWALSIIYRQLPEDYNHISDVMASVLGSSAADCGFEPGLVKRKTIKLTCVASISTQQ
jgi:hypothetical protein